MSVGKYRSWCLTVRPRNGVTIPIADALEKYCKSFPYYQMVLEMEGEARHAHIQIWSDTPTTKGDTNKKIERLCAKHVEDWDQAQCRILRQGTKIAYSDWIENYCIENDLKGTPNIVLDNRPLNSDEYYPSKEEQDVVQRKKNAVDQRMCALEIMFEEWYEQRDDELTPRLVGEFLSDMMFNSRKIACVNRAADRYALCKTLYAYITRSCDATLFYKPPEPNKATLAQMQQLKDSGYTDADINKIFE